MGAKIGKSGGYNSDINVTPLVDVVLVLLIIFMVVTPMLQRGVNVELPAAKNLDDKKTAHEQLTIAVTAEGQLYFEDTAVSASELEQKLKHRLAYNPGIDLFIKGDRRLDYASVRDVMGACRDAGAKRVVLAAKERKEGTAP